MNTVELLETSESPFKISSESPFKISSESPFKISSESPFKISPIKYAAPLLGSTGDQLGTAISRVAKNEEAMKKAPSLHVHNILQGFSSHSQFPHGTTMKPLWEIPSSRMVPMGGSLERQPHVGDAQSSMKGIRNAQPVWEIPYSSLDTHKPRMDKRRRPLGEDGMSSAGRSPPGDGVSLGPVQAAWVEMVPPAAGMASTCLEVTKDESGISLEQCQDMAFMSGVGNVVTYAVDDAMGTTCTVRSCGGGDLMLAPTAPGSGVTTSRKASELVCGVARRVVPASYASPSGEVVDASIGSASAGWQIDAQYLEIDLGAEMGITGIIHSATTAIVEGDTEWSFGLESTNDPAGTWAIVHGPVDGNFAVGLGGGTVALPQVVVARYLRYVVTQLTAKEAAGLSVSVEPTAAFCHHVDEVAWGTEAPRTTSLGRMARDATVDLTLTQSKMERMQLSLHHRAYLAAEVSSSVEIASRLGLEAVALTGQHKLAHMTTLVTQDRVAVSKLARQIDTPKVLVDEANADLGSSQRTLAVPAVQRTVEVAREAEAEAQSSEDLAQVAVGIVLRGQLKTISAQARAQANKGLKAVYNEYLSTFQATHSHSGRLQRAATLQYRSVMRGVKQEEAKVKTKVEHAFAYLLKEAQLKLDQNLDVAFDTASTSMSGVNAGIKSAITEVKSEVQETLNAISEQQKATLHQIVLKSDVNRSTAFVRSAEKHELAQQDKVAGYNDMEATLAKENVGLPYDACLQGHDLKTKMELAVMTEGEKKAAVVDFLEMLNITSSLDSLSTKSTSELVSLCQEAHTTRNE
jgi:hypothetical protein